MIYYYLLLYSPKNLQSILGLKAPVPTLLCLYASVRRAWRRWTLRNIKPDFGPKLCKCYTNVPCLLGQCNWRSRSMKYSFYSGAHREINIKPATIGNYRPATNSLGNCMEHIIVSSISITHLYTNKILNPLQHGFSLGNDYPPTASYCHYNSIPWLITSVTIETDLPWLWWTLARLLIKCHTWDSYTSLSCMGSGVEPLATLD